MELPAHLAAQYGAPVAWFAPQNMEEGYDDPIYFGQSKLELQDELVLAATGTALFGGFS